MTDHATRVAVVGCGGWGKNIVRSLEAIGHLAAIVETSEAGRATAAKLAPDTPVRDLDEILADGSIPGVMIATPAETHYAIARRCLEAGKDVFVEKPLTIHLEEARSLCDLADRLGRILMVGHLLEYHPAILTLHEMIRRGDLGNIRYVMSNRLNLGKVRTQENALWSFAPHDIAVILRLVGRVPCQVVATGGAYVSPNIYDTTVTQLLFDDGTRSHVYVSWLHPFKEQKLVVVGDKQMATFDDVAKELLLYDQRVEWQKGEPTPVRGEGIAVDYPDDEPLKAECRHFIQAIDARRQPRTCGRSGLRVLQILHAAQQSLAMNGMPTSVSIDEPTASELPIVETMAGGRLNGARATTATSTANGNGHVGH